MSEGRFELPPNPELTPEEKEEKTDWSRVEKIAREKYGSPQQEEKPAEKTDWSRVEEIARRKTQPEPGPANQSPDKITQVLAELQQRRQATGDKLTERQQAILAEAQRLQEIRKQRPWTPEEEAAFRKLIS